MVREQVTRLVGIAAAAIVVVVLIVVFTSGGSGYVVHAEFSDAGQLVPGDLVTIAGHKVGSVGKITLSSNGLADVALDITDDSIVPLRRDSLATIGQLSLTGIANRFVDLQPGPGDPIQNGGVLPVQQTHGIVDLDVVLDSLTPRVRASLSTILKTGAYFVRRPTVANLNLLAAYLNPAFSQATALSSELVSDRFSLERLISSTGQLSAKLASNSVDLGGAVSNTATVLREVSGARGALIDSLQRAPAVMLQARHVLSDVDASFSSLNPMLRALRPAAPKAATLLRKVVPFGHDFIPTLYQIDDLFPDAKRALAEFIPVEKKGVPALQSLASALKAIYPILTGLRPYAPDVTAGFFNGVGGSAFADYDANGHYLRTNTLLQGGGASLSGLLSILGDATAKIGNLDGARSGLTQTCPGGGGPPAADGSNAWTSGLGYKGPGALCDPSDDQRP